MLTFTETAWWSSRTANDGFYTDSPGGRGHATYIYQVLNAGTQTCSNQATVTF